MYLTRGNGYYHKSGEQRTQRASFLILVQPERGPGTVSRDNTYAIVRKVALRQLGHFMMGRANIAGKRESVSGSYGNDGLPVTVAKLPRDAIPLPGELFDAWNTGGGWNGAGSEAQAMRDWAGEVFQCR